MFEIGPSHLEAERLKGRMRRYEVCDDHKADYFGSGRFLSTQQLERIRRDLVPAAIGEPS